MKWISIKDKLPENGATVLTYPGFNKMPFGCASFDEGSITHNKFWRYNYNLMEVVIDNEVTHWMHLKAPKESK